MALLCAPAGKPVLSASCGTLATCPQPQAAAVSSLGKGAESSQVLTPPLPCQFKAIDPVGLCVYLPSQVQLQARTWVCLYRMRSSLMEWFHRMFTTLQRKDFF